MAKIDGGVINGVFVRFAEPIEIEGTEWSNPEPIPIIEDEEAPPDQVFLLKDGTMRGTGEAIRRLIG